MEWAEYTRILLEKCKNSGTPSSATFELTPFCNFNCNMCYIHLSPDQAKKQGESLTTEQWLHIAEEVKKLGTLGLEITGGEAVTRPDFPELYESFIKMGFLISLRSNGYLLNGDLLQLLVKYKPRGIWITLYGASNETYKKITGIDNGFTVVTHNILALREAGITPSLSVTLTKDNIADKAKIVEWAIKNDFFITLFGGLINPIRSAKRSVDHLRVDFESEYDISDIELPFREIHNREKYKSPFWMCREFGTKFCITWDGRMTLCNCLPSIWSSPLSQGVNDAYGTLYNKLKAVKRPADCADCQYIDFCGACPSQLLSATGSHEQTCKELCMRAERSYRRFLFNTPQNAHVNYNEEYMECGEGENNQ